MAMGGHRSAKLASALIAAFAPVAVLLVHERPVRISVAEVAFSPDGRALATLSTRGPGSAELRVYDLATFREDRAGRRPFPARLVVESDDRGLRLAVDDLRPRDLARWLYVVLPLRGYTASGELALSPDGRTIALPRTATGPDADSPSVIRLYDLETCRLVARLDDGQRVESLAFSPGGQMLAVAPGPLRLWDLESRTVSEVPNTSVTMPASFSPDGSLVGCQTMGAYRLWDVRTGEDRAAFRSSQAYTVAYSPDGRRVAVGSHDELKVWDLATNGLVAEFRGHNDSRAKQVQNDIANRLGLTSLGPIGTAIWSIAFAPDGRHGRLVRLGGSGLALGRRDGPWDCRAGPHP